MSISLHRSESDRELICLLRQEVEALNAQLARAQRLAAMGTAAAMAVHEINNILAKILTYAQLARDGSEAIRQKAIFHAHEGSSRARTISRALLGLATPDEMIPEKVAVAELVEQTLTAMARPPAKDGIRLIRRIPPRLRITTRPVELKQVLLNLLLNARAAVLEKGRGHSIAISALRRNGEVLIRVADTGVGIPAEHLEDIFEPFFTGRGGGTGLGLAVCRRLTTGLNGRLTVRSQAGKGTTFTVALPANGKPARAKRVPTKAHRAKVRAG